MKLITLLFAIEYTAEIISVCAEAVNLNNVPKFFSGTFSQYSSGCFHGDAEYVEVKPILYAKRTVCHVENLNPIDNAFSGSLGICNMLDFQGSAKSVQVQEIGDLYSVKVQIDDQTFSNNITVPLSGGILPLRGDENNVISFRYDYYIDALYRAENFEHCLKRLLGIGGENPAKFSFKSTEGTFENPFFYEVNITIGGQLFNANVIMPERLGMLMLRSKHDSIIAFDYADCKAGSFATEELKNALEILLGYKEKRNISSARFFSVHKSSPKGITIKAAGHKPGLYNLRYSPINKAVGKFILTDDKNISESICITISPAISGLLNFYETGLKLALNEFDSRYQTRPWNITVRKC